MAGDLGQPDTVVARVGKILVRRLLSAPVSSPFPLNVPQEITRTRLRGPSMKVSPSRCDG